MSSLPLEDQYQGDPKIFLEQNGSFLQFLFGQPIMDADIWNAVLISLNTREGWAGNVFFRKDVEKIGSDFEETTEEIISIQAINAMANSGKRALQWLIDVVLASEISFVAINPSGHNLEFQIEILKPDGSILKIVEVKNGERWIAAPYTNRSEAV
jgi:phage gp46-like protein